MCLPLCVYAEGTITFWPAAHSCHRLSEVRLPSLANKRSGERPCCSVCPPVNKLFHLSQLLNSASQGWKHVFELILFIWAYVYVCVWERETSMMSNRGQSVDTFTGVWHKSWQKYTGYFPLFCQPVRHNLALKTSHISAYRDVHTHTVQPSKLLTS